ncbi:hypothetical protein QBC34DRAFT_386490 [Podospora aff. communis PSN243]|uniref:Uncharacterized protein n=1 Tax=Podospora aff. communis PSN243 TaxID=3040156 RepID=A0AAV9G538_9PEZI|nr:hypothetical protein QBC34DRAFT_386490 [Podospora aff. communis PSN243]
MTTLSKLTSIDWKHQRRVLEDLIKQLQSDVTDELAAQLGVDAAIEEARMVAARWFPECTVKIGKCPARVVAKGHSASEIYALYCRDIRPDIPPMTINKVGSREFLHMEVPSFHVKEKQEIVTGLNPQKSAPIVAQMLIDMRRLRQKLWEELCPQAPLFEGCSTWELPFPPGSDLDACFYGDKNDDEYLYWRPLPGDLPGRHKIVLLIRPGITSLRQSQKRALKEAWQMPQEWRICLSLEDGRNVDLLTFATQFQAQSFENTGTTVGGEGVDALRKFQAEKDSLSQKQVTDDMNEVHSERERLEEAQTRLEEQKKKLEMEIETVRNSLNNNYATMKSIKLEVARLDTEEEDIAKEKGSLAAKEADVLSQVDDHVRKRFCLKPRPVETSVDSPIDLSQL